MEIDVTNIDEVIKAFAEIEEIAEKHGCAVRLDRNIGRIGLDGPAEACEKARDEIRRVFGKRNG
jgi:hypothetical protein